MRRNGETRLDGEAGSASQTRPNSETNPNGGGPPGGWGPGGTTDRTDRGQAHTVEAFLAALLLISGLLFAMQATAVTPLSASTSNQHIENQQRALADGLLDTAAEDGSLQEAILYWNTTREAFQDSPETGYYTDENTDTEFLRSLNRTLAERRIAYNVELQFHGYDDNTDTPYRPAVQMVLVGTPSDNAVTASRTVTLYNQSRLTGTDSSTLTDSGGSFYAPPIDDGAVYNRVEVRITTWRM